MKRLAAPLIAAFVLAAPQAAAKLEHERVMALVSHGRTQVLRPLDARTLEPRPGAIVIGRNASATVVARSPGGSRVAALADGVLKIVDLVQLRVTRSVPLSRSVVAGVWARPNRLALLDAAGGVRVVTLGKRTSWRWHGLDGEVVAWTKTPSLLAAIVVPGDEIGPATLAVVDADGRVRTVALPGVTAGHSTSAAGEEYVVQVQIPAVAVDPAGTRAVVVPASGPMVDVDLATLTTTRHVTRSLAKVVQGSQRSAVWFAPNLVAVTGADAGGSHEWTPAGLTLVDTGDWSTRIVEDGIHAAAVIAGTLVAYGRGLTGYDSGGRRVFHALDDAALWTMGGAGRYAYVSDDNRSSFAVVDVTTGEVVARPTMPGSTWIVGPW